MSPSRTLASTSSSPRSDRIGLFAAKTRGVADVRHRNNDVLRGRPRKCGTRGCSTGDSGREHSVEYPALSFRALAREQLPRLLSLARRLVAEDAEDRLFPGRQTTSPIGRRCFGRIGVPASPTGASGPDWAWHCAPPGGVGWLGPARRCEPTRPLRMGPGRSMQRVHHGDGRAGFWEPL